MKKSPILLLALFTLLLAACSGSDVYRGTWKATDAKGEKSEITFEAKRFSIKDSTGETKTHGYSQNSIKIENSVKTYGIKLDDGRGYQVYFPNAKDETTAFLTDENHHILYTMGRNEYVAYNDVYTLE